MISERFSYSCSIYFFYFEHFYKRILLKKPCSNQNKNRNYLLIHRNRLFHQLLHMCQPAVLGHSFNNHAERLSDVVVEKL